MYENVNTVKQCIKKKKKIRLSTLKHFKEKSQMNIIKR